MHYFKAQIVRLGGAYICLTVTAFAPICRELLIGAHYPRFRIFLDLLEIARAFGLASKLTDKVHEDAISDLR
jgi:hypothetical protein